MSARCPACGRGADAGPFENPNTGELDCYHPCHNHRASIDDLRRVARAAKPFAFYARSLTDNPGEYVMRVPKDEADEIQRAVDALWGTDDYATTSPGFITAEVAALKDARDLLARIEEAQEFDAVTGETTIHPGEVLDDIGATVDRIDAILSPRS